MAKPRFPPSSYFGLAECKFYIRLHPCDRDSSFKLHIFVQID